MAKKKSTKGTRGSRSRRGKGESMTGKKAARVEVRTVSPGIGDNSGLALPAPDDWNHHKRTISGWREKVTTAQSHLRNAIKTAKKSGINMESLNLVVGVERENDPTKTLDFLNQIGLGLELSETTIRITAHDTLAGDEKDLVYKRGVADGKAGRSAECKYPDGSDLAALYSKGWRHGTASNLGITPAQSDKAFDEGQADIEDVVAGKAAANGASKTTH